MKDEPRRANSDMLRHEIDSGRTGSKVDFSDPAAAPLGTDDEAAGTPPKASEVDKARDQERFDRPPDFTRPRDRSGAVVGHGAVWLLAVIVVVAIAVIGLVGVTDR
ncbi:MAG: hypothetical protein J0H82_11205 [Alphaproteobacteria bacterium]|jgi:hypothetical protein|nr:hypothetical protein [Alphaproteobacteria bacterium]